MRVDTDSNEELVRKYRLAGKIRFISFSLLLFFLLLMKSIGGYSYLNIAFITLILVEAILNQPYGFILKGVNIYRFQYYQMMTDIIVISWVLHYMGGIEAPLVSIAYYAVILWAGVVSTIQAVFFAVVLSAICFSSVAVLEHFEILPFVSYYEYKMPTAQMLSLLFGNVSFLFAFGYFSAHSSSVIKFLQRKREEESLRYVHKLLATGHLVGSIAHDILNYLLSIRGYVKLLLEGANQASDEKEKLKSIDRLEHKSTELLIGLSKFSKKTKHEFKPTDINKTIEDALELTRPLVRYSKMTVEKILSADIPPVSMDQGQFQEAFVALVLNSLDAMAQKEGILTIKTRYIKEKNNVEVIFADTGMGIRQEHLNRVGEPFFTTKDPIEGSGLGLATVYGVVARHKGKIDVESTVDKGTIFTIQIPIIQLNQKK